MALNSPQSEQRDTVVIRSVPPALWSYNWIKLLRRSAHPRKLYHQFAYAGY